MRIHRLLVGYECKREIQGLEAQSASDVVIICTKQPMKRMPGRQHAN